MRFKGKWWGTTAAVSIVAGALLLPLGKQASVASSLSPADSQAITWKLIHGRPAVGKYEDLTFPDPKHGWLISAGGFILHSSDSGVTWKEQATKLGALRSIEFVDAKRGFAGTVMGILYGTTDGGTTWKNISATLPRAPRGFCGMAHFGEKVHLVGRYYGGVADYYYSPDGGKTWEFRDLSKVAQGLVDVNFVSDNVGFIGGMALRPDTAAGAGPAAILKTTDGGKNWRVVFKHQGGRGYAWKVFPVSPNVIYAALQSQDGVYRIAKSVDAGEKWEVLTVASGQRGGPNVQGIGFLDENTGWVGGFFQGMYQTRDGGKKWELVSVEDRTINRVVKVGSAMFTAGSRGILRYAR